MRVPANGRSVGSMATTKMFQRRQTRAFPERDELVWECQTTPAPLLGDARTSARVSVANLAGRDRARRRQAVPFSSRQKGPMAMAT